MTRKVKKKSLLEEVRCEHCNKLLLKREKGVVRIAVEVQCARCGKVNRV